MAPPRSWTSVPLLILLWTQQGEGEKLERFNIDPNSITVSGHSSGAAFAAQFHVAFSRQVAGIGTFGGIPFHCGAHVGSWLNCMNRPDLVNINLLISETETLSVLGSIDNVDNLRNDKVYLFHGLRDEVFDYGILDKISHFYHYFSVNGEIVTVDNVPGNHGVPSDNYGTQCGELNYNSYIENCNLPAFRNMFKFFFGEDTVNSNDTQGLLQPFDQGEFFNGLPLASSMGETGYVYVPERCREPGHQCRLHINFHGCSANIDNIGFSFIENSGILPAALAHDVIVLFPQIEAVLGNADACWNWYAYLIPDVLNFFSKNGLQMAGVHRMLERAAGL